MKYRKKPIVIDAIQWSGNETDLDTIFEFMPPESLPNDGIHVKPGVGFTPVHGTLDIPTLEGTITASPGDWIIKGIQGEFYPCKPDIFAATYEPV